MAIVAGIYPDGVALKFASEAEAGQKHYMLFAGCRLAVGDKVLCARVAGSDETSGTWVVMSPVVNSTSVAPVDFAEVAAHVENNDDHEALRFSVNTSKQVFIYHPKYGWLRLN